MSAAAAAAVTATAVVAYTRAGVIARASWDTNPSPKPLRVTRTPKPAPKPSAPQTLQPTATRTAVLEKEESVPLSQILFSGRHSRTRRGKLDEKYLGFDRWLPIAPEVKKPRSIYNAATLAYLGDCIYELYARRHFLFPPLSINEYNERVMKVVRCEAQDILLKKLLNEEYLTEDERDVLRWGKNIVKSKTRTTKRVGVAVYNSASSLETLIGFLYLIDVKRLEDIMLKLGFSTGASAELIAEATRMNLRRQPMEPQVSEDLR